MSLGYTKGNGIGRAEDWISGSLRRTERRPGISQQLRIACEETFSLLHPQSPCICGKGQGMSYTYRRGESLRKTTLSVLLILVLAQIPAWAVLGQTEASVTSDQQRMKTEDRVQTFASYKVHQLATENGPTVREYVSPQGVVFGVAWQGRMPDLNALLGTYTENLQTATPAQTHVRHLRGVTIKTNDFVFSNFCHMRTCEGRAYVPGLVPNNVLAGVVR